MNLRTFLTTLFVLFVAAEAGAGIIVQNDPDISVRPSEMLASHGETDGPCVDSSDVPEDLAVVTSSQVVSMVAMSSCPGTTTLIPPLAGLVRGLHCRLPSPPYLDGLIRPA